MSSFLEKLQAKHKFPQGNFDLLDGKLRFHYLNISELIEKYGTPFRLTYLPVISNQIRKARNIFNNAIERKGYTGKYQFCYCTKVNHFSFVVEKAMTEDVHIETSSSLDIELLFALFKKGKLKKDRFIIHNGVKSEKYLNNIIRFQKEGFTNSIIVLDNKEELEKLMELSGTMSFKLGVRLAIIEEKNSQHKNSRLGMSAGDILNLYEEIIAKNDRLILKMVHFFVDSGIEDTAYYWEQFHAAISLYTALKKKKKNLSYFNIGGGFPIQNNLSFEYPYGEMAEKIIEKIQFACLDEKVEEPDVFTEFGKYTVGESGALIFKVDHHKYQNENEHWYIVDSSLMNTIPDAYSIGEKFILLPINNWNNPTQNVNLGGMSCDHSDYYNRDSQGNPVELPRLDVSETSLYVGFFHTAAYQDSVSGYGGIKHCLIPAPKHLIIDQDENGILKEKLFSEEHGKEQMLQILGYR